MRTPEEIKAYQKKWREANKEKRAEYAKKYKPQWYAKNKDKVKIQSKKWAEANPDKVKKKALKYYYRNKDKQDAYSRDRRKNQPEKVAATLKKYRQTTKGYFNAYKCNARRRGRTFSLSYEDFKDLVLSPCSYCGDGPAKGIDRVDNEKGYSAQNSIPCCHHCNRMKWTHSSEYFLQHIEKIYKHCTSPPITTTPTLLTKRADPLYLLVLTTHPEKLFHGPTAGSTVTTLTSAGLISPTPTSCLQ